MSKKIMTAVSGGHFILFGDGDKKYRLSELAGHNPGEYHFELRKEDLPKEMLLSFTINTGQTTMRDIFWEALRKCRKKIKDKLTIDLAEMTPNNVSIITRWEQLQKSIDEVYDTFGEWTLGYQNPVPSLNDTYVSRNWGLSFTFPEPVDKEDAVKGIQQLIDENGGKIPAAWIRMGEPKSLRLAAPQNK